MENLFSSLSVFDASPRFIKVFLFTLFDKGLWLSFRNPPKHFKNSTINDNANNDDIEEKYKFSLILPPSKWSLEELLFKEFNYPVISLLQFLLNAWINPYSKFKILSNREIPFFNLFFFLRENPNRKNFSFQLYLRFTSSDHKNSIVVFFLGKTAAIINMNREWMWSSSNHHEKLFQTEQHEWKFSSQTQERKWIFLKLSRWKWESEILFSKFHPICVVVIMLRVEWRDEWNLVVLYKYKCRAATI